MIAKITARLPFFRKKPVTKSLSGMPEKVAKAMRRENLVVLLVRIFCALCGICAVFLIDSACKEPGSIRNIVALAVASVTFGMAIPVPNVRDVRLQFFVCISGIVVLCAMISGEWSLLFCLAPFLDIAVRLPDGRPFLPLSTEFYEAVAIHETGHALLPVAICGGESRVQMSFMADNCHSYGTALAETTSAISFPAQKFAPDAELRWLMLSFLAGWAAESMFAKKVSAGFSVTTDARKWYRAARDLKGEECPDTEMTAMMRGQVAILQCFFAQNKENVMKVAKRFFDESSIDPGVFAGLVPSVVSPEVLQEYVVSGKFSEEAKIIRVPAEESAFIFDKRSLKIGKDRPGA